MPKKRKPNDPPAKPPDMVWISRRDQPVRRYEWATYTRKEIARMLTDDGIPINRYVSLEAIDRLIKRAIKTWSKSPPSPQVIAALTQLRSDIKHLKENSENGKDRKRRRVQTASVK